MLPLARFVIERGRALAAFVADELALERLLAALSIFLLDAMPY
jgi:hypothetical protein